MLKNEIFKLCLDSYGAHVIKTILIHGSEDHRSQIFIAISTAAFGFFRLIQNQYGNFVIQHALRM